jgi:hypothetical protein
MSGIMTRCSFLQFDLEADRTGVKDGRRGVKMGITINIFMCIVEMLITYMIKMLISEKAFSIHIKLLDGEFGSVGVPINIF